jgi:hypothetical protein
MKLLLPSLFLSFTLASLNAADEAKTVTYEGKIAGVVCASCKEHVAGALKQKLPEVISVDVKPGESPDAEEKKLIIVASSGTITKETATEALGTYAKNYTIKSLEKKN